MTDIFVVALAAVAITFMICATLLRGFRDWLDLQRSQAAPQGNAGGDTDIATRIELAAVRERLKRLEEIASGVEL